MANTDTVATAATKALQARLKEADAALQARFDGVSASVMLPDQTLLQFSVGADERWHLHRHSQFLQQTVLAPYASEAIRPAIAAALPKLIEELERAKVAHIAACATAVATINSALQVLTSKE